MERERDRQRHREREREREKERERESESLDSHTPTHSRNEITQGVIPGMNVQLSWSLSAIGQLGEKRRETQRKTDGGTGRERPREIQSEEARER